MMPFSPKPLTNSSTRPCGLSKVHKILLGGVELIPDLSGAIYVPEFETLIIADLHLEQGSSLARRGIHVPPFDTAMTLALLEQVVPTSQAKRLIFLGDSFHDGDGEARLDEVHLARLRKITKEFETFWICGNHDPEPPQTIGGHGADMIMLGPLTLRHEPSKSPHPPVGTFSHAKAHRGRQISSPSPVPFGMGEGGRRPDEGSLAAQFEIAGHLHPGCGINQRGRRIYGKCFVSDESRLIMPAFGAFTGGLNINSKAFAGLLDKETAQAIMIGRAALHRFPMEKISSF
jgi:uncharacterized protein